MYSHTAALMSIRSPRKNWHVPKQFVNEYSSETVVDKTILLILCDSRLTIEPKPYLDVVFCQMYGLAPLRIVIHMVARSCVRVAHKA